MTIPLNWFPKRLALDTMPDADLLALGQLAEDWEIKAKIRGDAYGIQVCRERRALVERAYTDRLLARQAA